MKLHVTYSLLICLLLPYNALTAAESSELSATSSSADLNRAVLIFLNDSESDTAADRASKIGATTIAWALAFAQEAGPIIVSASILDNMREREKPADMSDAELVERFNLLDRKFNQLADAELLELKNIYRDLLPFDQDKTDLFVIKKINEALYLIVPKKYLKNLHIDEKDVADYTDAPVVTKTERQLGLRVNHMQTVTNIDEIKKPLPEPRFASYFTNALSGKAGSIFITNAEYYAHNDKNIPLWSIFINGHGFINHTITGLTINQFKNFLTFLEHKIHTKLLYYLSCYAAGVNNQKLYEDSEKGIDKTYSFSIVAQAITDATVGLYDIDLAIEANELIMYYYQHYRRFVEAATTTEMLDYKSVAECFETFLSMGRVNSIFPQVKLPGLPWFSVIHENRVCSIGSILAKTRTKPLSIETFFARRGKKAVPIGILLYAFQVPFELIINSKTSVNLPPTIISMIPGDVAHHIKKISSSAHTVKDLVTSFFQIQNLEPQKLFIIDELVGSDMPKGVQNAVIELTPQGNAVYYMQNGVLYKNMTEKATAADAEEYETLLAVKKEFKNDASFGELEKILAQKQKPVAAPAQIVRQAAVTPAANVQRVKQKKVTKRSRRGMKRKKMRKRCIRK